MSSNNVASTEPVDSAPPVSPVSPPPIPPTKAPATRRQFWQRVLLGALIALLLLTSVIGGSVWLHLQPVPKKLVEIHRATPGGNDPWANDTRETAPSAQYAIFAQQRNPVDPAFQAYYTREHGSILLGNALTPAYLTNLGLTQIFANGALVVPTQSGTSGTSASASDLDPSLLHAGAFDSATGVVRLPLIDALLSAGSKIPLGGDDSTLTYVDVRAATAPDKLAHLQIWRPVQSATQENGVFITESTSHGIAYGHTVPLSVWGFITRSDIAPNGWQDAFGEPLTEALPTTATINGASHSLLVQAFALATVVIDQDDLNANDDPTGTILPIGRDYLETLGPPSVIVPSSSNVWLTGNTAMVNAPGSKTASVHLGLNFPLALTGKTQWLNGALWYQATWQSPHSNGTGWTTASTVTIIAPAKGAPTWASFDALSPDIASYLASFGTNVASVVYDLTRNRYYTYNENTPFVLASSSKVSIMIAYLKRLESEGRGPNDDENALLTAMIEHSDNNAAQALYDSLGAGPGMSAFYQSIGVAGYHPDPAGWGWASLPPIGQTRVLTLLQTGQILTAHDRAYALNLMTHIESDQRMGVGVTLPPGATVAMKDGWVPAQDGLWAINTSGIVTDGNEVYIIVVYTAHQYNYNGAWAITEKVCKTVGPLLV